MRVAITGSSGMLGSVLTADLERVGHSVTRMVRDRREAAREGRIYWSPATGEIDIAGLEGHTAVIHLAGENLFGLWTEKRKERIRRSRTEGTRLLAATLASLERPPQVLLSASAVGYYGDRKRKRLTEDAPAGEGFLADVVREWERAADPARESGIRVVNLRFGVVLSPNGGALAVMLPIFRLGIGGRIGKGEQCMSWVALHEIPHVVRHVLEHDSLQGPVNVVAPQTVSHAEFVDTLGDVLHRPTLFRVPVLLTGLLPGEMVEDTLLASADVIPQKLKASGYRFHFPRLADALRHELSAD